MRKFPQLRYLFSRESFYMADRTGVDSTTLHYLAVQKAMVSIHWPVRLKITVTYPQTWQTDCWRALYTPKNGFRSGTKSQGGRFLSFAQTFSALIVSITYQNGVPLKHSFVYCRSCHNGHGHNDDLPTLNLRSTLYVTHVTKKKTGPIPIFCTASDEKLGRVCKTRLLYTYHSNCQLIAD